jgi:FtsP/CotA-like multicopper oxidase with cupredoxin domain
VLLSDFPNDDPERILRNLKVDPGYYNDRKRTLPDFFRDARRFGLSAAMKDRMSWGRMRMDPTDIADVAGYTFLVNGKPAAANETLLFRPGEKVRLRFINAAAMTFFDVRIPGLKMTVVAADGREVEPVPVDEFRLAVAETYDVLVEPQADRPSPCSPSRSTAPATPARRLRLGRAAGGDPGDAPARRAAGVRDGPRHGPRRPQRHAPRPARRWRP